MKHTLLVLLLAAAAASAQSGRTLPPDIDARSYSRLPLIPKDSLGAEGRRVFEAINGKDASVPRMGPWQPSGTFRAVRQDGAIVRA
jgi:hypothetical protein